MAKGRFNVKGTKDFLVGAVFFAFLCLWSIRDAWFPTQKVLEKHPLSVPVAMDVSGVVESVGVDVDDEVEGKMLLVKLIPDSYQKAVDAAKKEFDKAEAEKNVDAEEKLNALLEAREKLKACTLYNTDRTMTTSHGEEALRGVVLEVVAPPATYVKAGDPVLRVRPQDTFYAFNKSLAVISFIGMIVMLIFHRIASK